MSGFLSDDLLWSVAVILVIPAVIVGAAELEERLRQSESALRTPVLTFRNWVLPFLAAWALLAPVLGREDTWYVRMVATGLLISLAVTGWQILRVIGANIRARPAEASRRQVPALVLVLPRLALVIGTATLLLAGVWGVDLSSALAALGVTSLVVSFALQDTLSGLASGVLLLSDRPFKPGDWISADELEGEVMDINWRTSRIRDRNGDVIVVPNSQLANASVINHSAPEPLHRVVVCLQVAFANPPTLAKDMLLDAARSVPGVLTEPAPDVLVTTIDDPLMGYSVHLWVRDFAIVPRVRGDFGALVWYMSHRHNVPLPSPAQDLFLHDPIAEAKAAEPTLAARRDALATSALLAELPDDDLDRLAQRSHRTRFRAGELMFDSGSEERDLLVVVEGNARLVLLEPGFDEAVVNEVGVGDIVGLLATRRGDDRLVALRAFTDCEAIVVAAGTVDEVASRNADVVTAFNRLVALRQRRINRLVELREPMPASPSAQAGGS
ncbi:MAG: mechanosensitive ion channel domain-containing protein [Candidatus Nanopelagicales bacterium]